jgi:hypothetical protein
MTINAAMAPDTMGRLNRLSPSPPDRDVHTGVERPQCPHSDQAASKSAVVGRVTAFESTSLQANREQQGRKDLEGYPRPLFGAPTISRNTFDHENADAKAKSSADNVGQPHQGAIRHSWQALLRRDRQRSSIPESALRRLRLRTLRAVVRCADATKELEFRTRGFNGVNARLLDRGVDQLDRPFGIIKEFECSPTCEAKDRRWR